MPGSRKSEIKALMPIFKELANLLDREITIAIPPHFKNSLDIYGDIRDFKITFDSKKALMDSDFAFICSGTATLEAGIIGTPFILTYRAKSLDYFIGKRLIKLNYIGLANIFFEKMGRGAMHPELIQDDVNVDSLIDSFKNFNFDKFLEDSKLLREYLKYGSAENVAKELLLKK